jgi:hypothetical protein
VCHRVGQRGETRKIPARLKLASHACVRATRIAHCAYKRRACGLPHTAPVRTPCTHARATRVSPCRATWGDSQDTRESQTSTARVRARRARVMVVHVRVAVPGIHIGTKQDDIVIPPSRDSECPNVHTRLTCRHRQTQAKEQTGTCSACVAVDAASVTTVGWVCSFVGIAESPPASTGCNAGTSNGRDKKTNNCKSTENTQAGGGECHCNTRRAHPPRVTLPPIFARIGSLKMVVRVQVKHVLEKCL